MSFVVKIDLKEAKALEKNLREGGFEISVVPHALFCASKPGVRCTAYTSGKLTAQGKGVSEFVEFTLEPLLGRFDLAGSAGKEGDERAEFAGDLEENLPRIGQDEAGKGDLFGPLCVAGVLIDRAQVQILRRLKIRDSKSIGDKPLRKLALEIRARCPVALNVFSPKLYNSLYARFQNLNRLLAWSHAQVFQRLSDETGCRAVLIDQFANSSVLATAFKSFSLTAGQLEQRVRAESDLAVACASIVARDAFLQWMEKTSEEIQFQLPRGAGPPARRAACELLQSRDREKAQLWIKWHFKTVREILGVDIASGGKTP